MARRTIPHRSCELKAQPTDPYRDRFVAPFCVFAPLFMRLAPPSPIHGNAMQHWSSFSIRKKLTVTNFLQTVLVTLVLVAASGWMLPGATRAILDIDEQTAIDYLDGIALELRAQGVKVSPFVRRGDPSQQIINAAQAQNFDLVVLATHGKGGMKAFWAGSVGPKVVIEARIPLLLVPVNRK